MNMCMTAGVRQEIDQRHEKRSSHSFSLETNIILKKPRPIFSKGNSHTSSVYYENSSGLLVQLTHHQKSTSLQGCHYEPGAGDFPRLLRE